MATGILLVAMLSFGAGIAVERRMAAGSGSTALGSESVLDSIDVQRIEEMLQLLDAEYLDGPIDRTQALYEALAGMVEGVTDDQTVFLKPDPIGDHDTARLWDQEGIGLWLDSPRGRLTVVSAMNGSSAAAAGLRAGDEIVAIDGLATERLRQDQAIERIRGPVGTEVRLTVARAGLPEPLELVVERAAVAVPPVSLTMLESGIAHIVVSLFSDETAEELDRALAVVATEGATGLILDLRNNGGGLTLAAQQMVGRFVPASAGPAFYEDYGRRAEMPTPAPILPGGAAEFDLPMVVLVNEGTASAAEIVAGALRDYERARLVGMRTFGKGSLQRIHRFDDGSQLRVTVARWLTPSGHAIQDQGIVPEFEVPMPPEPDWDDPDPQLTRAVQVLLEGE